MLQILLTDSVKSICNINRFDRVFVQLDGDFGSQMHSMRQKYLLLMEEKQKQCKNNPPVLRPRIGIAVTIQDLETRCGAGQRWWITQWKRL